MHTQFRGQKNVLPVKLFYTSNMPIILQGFMIQSIYFFSQNLYRRFKGNLFINLLGSWREAQGGHFVPVGGLVYYLSPINGLSELITDPLHSLAYITFVLVISALFGYLYLQVSG